MPFPFARSHPLQHLLLDPENPRLPMDLPRRENSILDYLVRNSAIEDLAASIGENGFFFAEALVAVPAIDGQAADEIDDNTDLLVVEGNRRLTALKVLQDPTVAERTIFRKIADEATHRPTKIQVIIYESRSEVLQFLGYRHITGVRPWDSLAKARYIEQLYNKTSDDESFISRYREVAQIVGSKSQYIRRSLNALTALNIAEENDYFGLNITEEDIDFSVLLTALGYVELQRFIISDAERLPNTHLFEQSAHVDGAKLRDLISWISVKGKNEQTRLVESRNLKKLAAIVSTDKALERFYAGATIEQAYVVSKGSESEFAEFLQDATTNLDEAAQLVAFVDYSETLDDMAKRALVQANHVSKSLINKNN